MRSNHSHDERAAVGRGADQPDIRLWKAQVAMCEVSAKSGVWKEARLSFSPVPGCWVISKAARFNRSVTLSPRPACAYAFAKSSPTSRTWHVL
jgi:hypothetical protein